MNTKPSLSGKIVSMSESTSPAFGRVEEDGTVYVFTATGERRVGQVPDVDPSEALGFFVRRYTSLSTEVGLLEQRLANGSVSADEAKKTISTLRSSIVDANAVGNLAALEARLDALKPALDQMDEARKAQRLIQIEQTKAAKEGMVAEARKLAAGNDWRGGVNRFRSLLDEWKALPRIDRATDDELWHQFSSARTTYTRRRKAQFAEQSSRHEAAKAAKEAIIARSRELSTSTDWNATAAAFRGLMADWKAAGSAQRSVDNALWAEFRAIQDEFFAARTAVYVEQDTEFKANLVAKEELLTKAEAELLPISDLAQARDYFRIFLNEYNVIGKVPRESMRTLDVRLRKLELALRDAEEAEWRRTDPEARQRASDTVNMFSTQIEKLMKQLATAEATNDTKKIAELSEAIQTYNSWLDSASKTLEEFSA